MSCRQTQGVGIGKWTDKDSSKMKKGLDFELVKIYIDSLPVNKTNQ